MVFVLPNLNAGTAIWEHQCKNMVFPFTYRTPLITFLPPPPIVRQAGYVDSVQRARVAVVTNATVAIATVRVRLVCGGCRIGGRSDQNRVHGILL